MESGFGEIADFAKETEEVKAHHEADEGFKKYDKKKFKKTSRSAKILPIMGQLDEILDYENGLKTGDRCEFKETYKKHDISSKEALEESIEKLEAPAEEVGFKTIENAIALRPGQDVAPNGLVTPTNRTLTKMVDQYFNQNTSDPHYDRVKSLKKGDLELAEAKVNEIMDRFNTVGQNEKSRIAFGGAIHLFYMTSQCNLNCSYCYQHLKGRPKHLPEPPLIKELIDQINKTDRPDEQTLYCIFGGEPMIEWKNCQFLMEYAYETKHNCHFNVTTNGVLLSKERFFKSVIKYLEDKPEIKQRVSFDISFDGVGSQDRVYYSGKDSTPDVIKTFGMISDYNREVGFENRIRWRARYTIHHSNISCFAKDILMIATTFGPDRIVTSIDNGLNDQEDPESTEKINWMLKEQIDFLRTQWKLNNLNSPVCHMFCDMCNSCGERKDHRFYYSGHGLSRIQNGQVRVGGEMTDFPDADGQNVLPNTAIPQNAIERLRILDTSGQGAGMDHLKEVV